MTEPVEHTTHTQTQTHTHSHTHTDTDTHTKTYTHTHTHTHTHTLYTVEPLLKDTLGHLYCFFPPMQFLNTFYEDTSLIRTLSSAPMVSTLENEVPLYTLRSVIFSDFSERHLFL